MDTSGRFEDSPSQNWATMQPDAMWDWFDPASDGRTARRFRQEYFGEWLDEPQPDLRWMSDPAAPVTTPLGDLVGEKEFPLRVRRHREYLDTVFVIVGDRGGWIAEVRDERIAHWIVRTVNDHWKGTMEERQS